MKCTPLSTCIYHVLLIFFIVSRMSKGRLIILSWATFDILVCFQGSKRTKAGGAEKRDRASINIKSLMSLVHLALNF